MVTLVTLVTGKIALRGLLILMLALVLPVGLQTAAAQSPGTYPPTTEGWQFRPQPPSNARGTPPPAQRAWPTAPNGWRHASPTPANRPAFRAPEPPQIEVVVPVEQAYIQQSLMMIVRLISHSGLASANISLDGIADVQTELLEGPVSRMRSGAHGREQLNEYHYLLRPLRTGLLLLAPVEVSATDLRGQHFDLQAAETPRLEVRPAPPEVRPWLPLQALSLSARVDPQVELAPGQPVTLTLDVQAEGGTAGQLPSLEPWLRAAGVRSYRERTFSETRLAAQGRQLLARRTEVYTLVPQTAGPLHLPEIRIAWWNLDTDQPAVARLPQHQLRGMETAEQRVKSEAAGAGLGGWMAWVPLSAVLLVGLGFIAGFWTRERRAWPLPDVTRFPRLPRLAGADWVGDPVTRAWVAETLSLWQKRWRRHSREQWLSILPRAWRFRAWLGRLEETEGVDAWAGALQIQLRQAGWMPPGQPLSEAAATLLPRAQAERQRALAALLADLETARYALQPLDLAAWRAHCLRQLRSPPGSVLRTWLQRLRCKPTFAGRTQGLPPLNPRLP